MNPKSTPKRFKPYSVPSKKFYIDKNDRTAHFVGYYKLKELDINDFLKENRWMIKWKRTDNLAVSEDTNVDKAISIDLRKE